MEFVIIYGPSVSVAVFFLATFFICQASCPGGRCPWVYSSTLSIQKLETQTTCTPRVSHHLQQWGIPTPGRVEWCMEGNLSHETRDLGSDFSSHTTT